MSELAPVAFYCVSSELYFPGAVALINSLRLVGHREPVFVLGCGLSPAHRALLEAEATVIEAPAEAAPYLLKTIAPSRRPAETMVLIDVDMVVTRRLDPLIEQAAEGRVIAFDDNLDRFVPEWGELLGLGPLSRRAYVSSGFVAMGRRIGADVLATWDRLLDRVDFERSWFERDEPDYPFRFIDQDVLNAVICALTEPDQLVAVDGRLAPHQPYRGVRLRDERRLRCDYRDGSSPYLLHQYLKKPWLAPMYHGIYSRLLSRLWLADDLPIRLDETEVPLRMRRGARALAARRATDAVDLARWYARDVIPERLASMRERRRDRSPR